MPSKKNLYRKCAVCGAQVQIQNLPKHFANVHPNFINQLHWIDMQDKCFICGKKGIGSGGVCREHVLETPQRFLVKDVFFPLKRKVEQKLREHKKECIHYLLVQAPMLMYASFGAEPGKKSPLEFVSFSTEAIDLGYSLLRTCEVYEDIEEVAYDLALKKSEGGLVRTRYDSVFLEEILSEHEFFRAAFYGMKGFYDIAIDSIEKPSTLLIIPRIDAETVRKMLLLRISHSDAIWRSSFVKIVRPSTQQCVLDERGAFFCFRKEKIHERYNVFASSWSKSFPSRPIPTAEEFDALKDLLKWVVCPFGFTRVNLSKAYNIEDFKNFGLSEDRLFSFLDYLLTEVRSNLHLISHRMLTKTRSIFEMNHNMMNVALGFSLSSSKGKAYFLPVREWFYNKTMPALIAVGRSIEASGRFFEEEMHAILKLLANDNIRLEYSEALGFVPVLKMPGPSKTKLKTDWKILEKNFPILIADPLIAERIGQEGEIDMIVYANYSLYLLELKSLNLSSNRAQKYIKEDAARQCAKYAAWARQKSDLSSFLKKHALSEDNIRSIRVICCTNGVFDNTEIVCYETDERFAVIPQFMLFSLFLGRVTVAVREVLPEEILGIRNGILKAIPTIKKIGIANFRRQLSKTANEFLSRWLTLMTYDRRKDYRNINFNEAKPLDLARFSVLQEVYVGDTWKWLLGEPVEIGMESGWKYYVGTQIANAGTTLVCASCKSAIKYYYAVDKQNNLAVADVLKKKVCPFCRKIMSNASEFKEILNKMTMIMANYKYEHSYPMMEEDHQA
jgi:hypothetical protein